MELTPAKLEILEALLLHTAPVKAATLAKEISKDFPATQMHLIGLAKAGYAQSPQKGQYLISNNGKKALGLAEITMEKARSILSQRPVEGAFHFYVNIDKPTNIMAQNLVQFRDELKMAPAESLMFHLGRGDFEAWFKFIGDAELARKTEILKKEKMTVDQLCSRLREIMDIQCATLSRIAGQSATE